MAGEEPPPSIDEEDVVSLTIEQVDLDSRGDAIRKRLVTQIEKLKVGKETKRDLKVSLGGVLAAAQDNRECELRDILSEIPTGNDDGCGDVCTAAVFRKRSMRVAKMLRQAAKVLAD